LQQTAISARAASCQPPTKASMWQRIGSNGSSCHGFISSGNNSMSVQHLLHARHHAQF
jgi:hypothetical protein